MLEFLIVTVVLAILFTLTISAYSNYKRHQAAKEDSQTVTAVLRQARSQSLISKNATNYGVHLATTSVTLFTGTAYSPSDPANQVTNLSYGVSLSSDLPAGADIVFARITGQTNQSGTVTIYLATDVSTSTIKVYKTGVIER